MYLGNSGYIHILAKSEKIAKDSAVTSLRNFFGNIVFTLYWIFFVGTSANLPGKFTIKTSASI
jgi:hypothetical protein